MIDYELLLKKYMKHVINTDGETLLDFEFEEKLNEEEIEALERIECIIELETIRRN